MLTAATKLTDHTTAEGIAVSVDELLKLRHFAENINLESFFNVKTTLTGTQSSPIRGRGIDFSEVRIYQPGDDIRHMDWKVTARTGKPHSKLFQEERERPVFIVVDYSPSMFFGTKKAFKSVVAAKTAAIFAWAALQHHDRIGGLVFSGQHTIEFRPQAGARGVLPLINALANHATPPAINDESTGLANALARIRRLAKSGSLLIILSDFLSLDKQAEQQINQLGQNNSIIAGFIYDPLEAEPPPPDRYAVSDGAQISRLDTRSKQFCKQYRAYFIDHLEHVKKIFRQQHGPLLTLATNASIVDCLRFNRSIKK